ncbi:hypothetical protein ES332_D11G319000v1 [Gossypium tomentosum]|uniref:Uncharacterized protein n=1 Tax=Gossypium tomentosum TaxID=34277 RepID=A0A5D2IWH2_GOSTO|nr:hypothetical protein ES332_D11G319000v1 [Gossypium tomentosum]
MDWSRLCFALHIQLLCFSKCVKTTTETAIKIKNRQQNLYLGFFFGLLTNQQYIALQALTFLIAEPNLIQ